jgi:hypothetical protein
MEACETNMNVLRWMIYELIVMYDTWIDCAKCTNVNHKP